MPNHWPRWITPLVCGAAALGLVMSFGLCTQDDAFISLRYAQNLVDGNGLVYNPGEYVEGYTNLLWTLLLAIPLAAGADPVTSSTWLGVLHFLGAVGAGSILGRQVAGESLWAVAPAVLLVMDPFASLEAVEGLETAQYMMVLAIGLSLFLREMQREDAGPRRFVSSSVVFAVAALVRPEAPILPALLHLGRLLHIVATERAVAWRALGQSAVAGVPVALVLMMLTGWRLAYYGDLLPNTFHAKTGAAGFAEGVEYLRAHASAHPGVWLLLCFGGVGCWKDRRSTAMAVATVGFLVYVASVGGDFKPTGRFLLPVMLWMTTLGALLGAQRSRRVQIGMAALVFGSTLACLPSVYASAADWAER